MVEAVEEGPVHTCEHEGCDETNTVLCTLLDFPVGEEGAREHLYYYCPNHCHEEGFCWMCGHFWAGCEDFDFSESRLCSNCRSEMKTEESEYDPEYDFGDNPL